MPERRVLKQLVEALLFEGIAELRADGLRPGSEQPLEFRLGRRRYVCTAKTTAFGRTRVKVSSLRALDAKGEGSVDWAELVEALPFEPGPKAEIAEDLANTVRLCEWNTRHLQIDRTTRRGHTWAELESSLHEGHPYHPCFKARSGFSLDDQERYSPEAGQVFPLCWVAVKRARLHQHLPIDEREFWRSELGESDLAALDAARLRNDAGPTDYGLLPVHPWQWSRLQDRDGVALALARRELVDLKLCTGAYRATQSVRTLMPADDLERAHVKLSLGTRITSSQRLLRTETLAAAPLVSNWLSSVVTSDPFFEEVAGLIILREYASSSYVPSEPQSGIAHELGALWRESIQRHLRAHEAAVPLNVLSVTEGDGSPFIEPWLSRHGIVTWLKRLFHVFVMPVWHLLVHHGIAVEAHAQNALLVHRNGWPERIALRDFHESVEYVDTYLNPAARTAPFTELERRFSGTPLDQEYAMSSIDQLRELFMDTVFVFNLSELAHLLDEHYGFDERRFWRLVDDRLDSYSRSQWTEPSRVEQIGHRAPRVRTESLLRARLDRGRPGGHHHWVTNSLHDAREPRRNNAGSR